MDRADLVLIGAESEENLAVRYLAAAAVRAGYRTVMVPLDTQAPLEIAVTRSLALNPRVIGLSMTFQAGMTRFLDLASALRAAGFAGHLTAGGQFATVAALRLLELSPELDSVVRGDGEETLVELLDRLTANRGLEDVLGVSVRSRDDSPKIVENPPRPALPDLDLLPWPLRAPPFLRQAGVPLAAMLGSRGCLQGCTYCSIQTYGRHRPGPRHRMRTLPAVVEEMADLYHRHDVRVFIFHDDNFLCPTASASLDRAVTLAALLRRAGLDGVSLVIKIRPDVVTEDVVWALKDAGVVRAYVGIESGNAHGLKVLGRGMSVDACHRALDAFAQIGVFACYNLLSFHPEATLDEVREDVAFARSHPEALFNLGRAEIYAGTPLERRLRRERRLSGPEFAPFYSIRDRRVELASRLVTLVFRRRAFELDGVLNLASSLGYEPAVIRRAWPEAEVGDLESAVTDFERTLVLDTAKVVESICALAADEAISREALVAAGSDLAWDVSRRDLALRDRLRVLEARVRALAGEGVMA